MKKHIFLFLLIANLMPTSIQSSYLAKAIDESGDSVPSLLSLSMVALARALTSKECDEDMALYVARIVDQGRLAHLEGIERLRKVLLKNMLIPLFRETKDATAVGQYTRERDDWSLIHMCSIALSPCGRLLAAADSRQVAIWDISDLEKPQYKKVLDGGPFNQFAASLHWLSDGEHLTGYLEGRLICWNVSTGRQVYNYLLSTNLVRFVGSRRKAAFTSDGHCMFSSNYGPKYLVEGCHTLCPVRGSGDDLKPLHDTVECVLLRTEDIRDHFESGKGGNPPYEVVVSHKVDCQQEGYASVIVDDNCVVISSDERFMATATSHDVYIRSIEAGPDDEALILHHQGIVCACAFSPKGNSMITFSKERIVHKELPLHKQVDHYFVLTLWNLSNATSILLHKYFVARNRSGGKAHNSFADYPRYILFDGRYAVFQLTELGMHLKFSLYVFDCETREWVDFQVGSGVSKEPFFFSSCGNYLITGDDINYPGEKGPFVHIKSLFGNARQMRCEELVILGRLFNKVLQEDQRGKASELLEKLRSPASEHKQ